MALTFLTPRHSAPSAPLQAAWEAFHEGTANPTALFAGDTASPSDTTVYEIVLDEPLVQVPVEIATDGAYALLIEHGSGEVSVVVTSPSGVVLTAGAAEGVEEHEDHDDHDDEHTDHDEDEDEGDSSGATAAQWGNAISATVVVSLCR